MSIPFEESFASNEKAKYWDYEKNIVEPKDISNNKSGKKYWFKCDKCNHSFDISLGNINKGSWCPYCCKPPKKLCNEECTFCFNKSFASHPKSIYWSNKNIKTPRQVFKSTGDKDYFDCIDFSILWSLNCFFNDNIIWCRLNWNISLSID